MGKDSTSIMITNVEPKKEIKSMGPKSITLSLIKQFARVYTYEPKLDEKLGSILAN